MADIKYIRENIIAALKDKNVAEPLFFTAASSFPLPEIEQLVSENLISTVHDEIFSQLGELMVIRNPDRKLGSEEKLTLINQHTNAGNLEAYGCWIYYPWSRKLIHVLNREEFIELRTSRNRNKITSEEQVFLQGKSVGIIGLSVGQSIALTVALERVCGEIRLADFDDVELSNINRIRTGIHNIGVNKAIVAAREIKEIDPYLNLKIYTDGLTQENMDDFFTNGGPLDLLIEVCDGIQVKIDSRLKAKDLNIPVVMDTNDRGMVDIERFDLEDSRQIFHGYLSEFASNGYIVTPENRRDVLNSILSYDSLSERMRLSMMEIGKSITTWPQLASSVVLGGAVTTDLIRKILLKQFTKSGRYYVDFDAIFSEEEA